MKNIRKEISDGLDRLDTRWRKLPLKTQVRYVLFLFAFYVVMGIGVLVKVCYDLGREDSLAIGHIKSPILLKSDQTEPVATKQKNSSDGRERK